MVNRAVVETKRMTNVEKKMWFYQAKTRTENEDKIYVGLSANEIKKRISVHKITTKIKPEDANSELIKKHINQKKK